MAWNDQLVIGELLEDGPEGDADLARFRGCVLSNPLYVNSLISPDASVTAIAVTPDTDPSPSTDSPNLTSDTDSGGFRETVLRADQGTSAPTYLTAPEGEDLLEALTELIDRHSAPDFDIRFAGGLAMIHRFNLGRTKDLATLLPPSKWSSKPAGQASSTSRT